MKYVKCPVIAMVLVLLTALSALAGNYSLPTAEGANCVTPYEDGGSPQVEVNNTGPSSVTATVTYDDGTEVPHGISSGNSKTFSAPGKLITELKICRNGGGAATGTYTVTPPPPQKL